MSVPWSGFDLINAFNAWKTSEEAGRVSVVGSDGTSNKQVTGLMWRHEVTAQVFEEAAVDLGRALAAHAQSRAGTRRGGRTGFPKAKRKGRCRDSFRLRNKRNRSGTCCIRVGESQPRSVTLPRIGTVRVHDDTRRLRRLLRTVRQLDDTGQQVLGPRAKILFATLRDRTSLRRRSRAVSRTQSRSRNRAKANRRLSRQHARIANIRRSFLHEVSSQLVKTHDRLCLEDLAIANLITNRNLARAIGDAAWAEFSRQLSYKATWFRTELVVCDRWFPSTKTCSGCGVVKQTMGLGDRTFCCSSCGLAIDRDRNAATNLAAWAERYQAQIPDRQAGGRATNAPGGEGTGHRNDGGTSPRERGTNAHAVMA